MKSVVICGSRRFKKEIRNFSHILKESGVVVYEPYLHEGKDDWNNLPQQYKKFTALGLTHDHFYKIRMSDVVYVYNKGGYAGVSTTMEIGAAAVLGKPIYSYETDDELARLVLFREIIKSPKALLKKLK